METVDHYAKVAGFLLFAYFTLVNATVRGWLSAALGIFKKLESREYLVLEELLPSICYESNQPRNEKEHGRGFRDGLYGLHGEVPLIVCSPTPSKRSY